MPEGSQPECKSIDLKSGIVSGQALPRLSLSYKILVALLFSIGLLIIFGCWLGTQFAWWDIKRWNVDGNTENVSENDFEALIFKKNICNREASSMNYI